MFKNEKLVGTEPFVEKKAPEYPRWMQQPEPGKTFDSFWLKPQTIKDHRLTDRVFIGLIVFALLAMTVASVF